jgi:gliding motility-associated-like protein
MFSIKNNSQNRRLKTSLFCVFISFMGVGQAILNIVNNPSFEQFNKCPTFVDNIKDADYWFNPTFGSPDYYNPCATYTNVLAPANWTGQQIARTGNSYAGIVIYNTGYTDQREYIGNGLKKTLDSNKTYCITFYLSLSDSSRIATADIGFYLSQDSVKLNTIYNATYTPVYETSTIIADTTNWTQVQTLYVASGNENFITIGCFKNDASLTMQQIKPMHTLWWRNYSYYYIDDVSIIEVNPANASVNDTLFKCSLDSIMLGTDSTEFATYSWFPSSGLSCTNCPNPIAKPTATTKYYLTKQQCSATTMDSVIVSILTPSTPAQAGSDKTICSGESAVLGTDSIANIFYSWQEVVSGGSSLSCTNCPQPTAMPDSSTSYILTRQECSFISYDTVRIFIDDCNPTFTVPTVFTPNYDGINDTWGIKFSSINHIENFSVDVYDRWGIKVFSNNPGSASPNSEFNTPNLKWDGHTVSGEECSSGTYFYIITFTKNDEVQKLKGFVSLFR